MSKTHYTFASSKTTKEMDLLKARFLVRELMEKHSLIDKGWYFDFDNARRRFGCCDSTYRKITMSKHLTLLNDEAEVRDTILHEIAHALVGAEHGHNQIWKKKAIEIGCNGKQYYDSSVVVTPPPNYLAICPNCKKEWKRIRRPTTSHSCGKCCSTYNPKYKLEFKKVK